MIVPGYIDRFSNGKKTFSHRLVDWREQFHTRRRAGKYCLYICVMLIYICLCIAILSLELILYMNERDSSSQNGKKKKIANCMMSSSQNDCIFDDWFLPFARIFLLLFFSLQHLISRTYLYVQYPLVMNQSIFYFLVFHRFGYAYHHSCSQTYRTLY